jgi:chromosome segregation ATPase
MFILFMATPPFDPFNKQKLAEEARRDAQIITAQKKAQEDSEKRKKRAVFESELIRVRRELNRVVEEKAGFEKDLKQAQTRLIQAEQQIDTFEKEIQKEERKIPELDRSVKAFDQVLKTIKQKIAAGMQRLSGKKSGAGSREEMLREHTARIEFLKRAIEKLTVEERDITNKIKELQQKLDQDKTERFRAEEEIKNLQVTDNKEAVQHARESVASHAEEEELKKLKQEEELKTAELNTKKLELEKEKGTVVQLQSKKEQVKRSIVADKERVRSAPSRSVRISRDEGRLREQEKTIQQKLDTLNRS